MSLAMLTDPNAVLQAIVEFDELGREAFLQKYGFSKATRYFVEHDGNRYDSKAIAGVAVGKQHPERGPLKSSEFAGGENTVKPKLEQLGFTVVMTEESGPGLDALRERWEAGGPWTDPNAEWRLARVNDVPEARRIMQNFLDEELDAPAFRAAMDEFSRRTGLAGFGGLAGQMFFNMLVRAVPEPDVSAALRAALPAPADKEECLVRFDGFLAFVERAREGSQEQQVTPPAFGYTPYFLSFFWEAQNRDTWPIYYPASRNTLVRHGLFEDKGPLPERYLRFRDRVIELRDELGGDTWEIESFLWTLNNEATKQPKPPTPPRRGEEGGVRVEPVTESLYDTLQLGELIFPDEVVTSLVLSLMTKPFVLLSGISGTGKTQLAVRLAEYLELRSGSREVEVGPPEDDDSNIYIRLTEARLKRARTNLTRVHQETIALQGGLPDRGTFKEYAVAVTGGPEGQMRLNNIGFADPQRELFLLFFRNPLAEWLRSNTQTGDYLHLRFEEDSNRVAAEVVSPALEAVAASRHVVVAVRSDWTDPRGLLGYRNPITGEYVETDTLRLLLDAAQTPATPFLLILDEMNLARVEYYFSDFLSAMELSDGAISLYAESGVEGEGTTDIPPRIPLPPNVLVIGTVNVDESTFMFSPKVLDRANVLAFNRVDVQRLFTGGGEDVASTFRLASGDLDPASLAVRESTQAFERARTFQPFSQALIELFTSLEREGRHFGYRVLREITTFVGFALELVEGNDEEAVWRTAFDLQIVQKVLPKLSGGRELEGVLDRLIIYCDPARQAAPHEVSVAEISEEEADESRINDEPHDSPIASPAPTYPRAARALDGMLRRLRETGFVSFFE